MAAELSTQCQLHQSLPYDVTNKENNWKKSLFSNDDQEMSNSDVWKISHEATDMQYQGNTDNFQIPPEEKWSTLNGHFTKYSKLENKKRCLLQKPLVYSGFAGDLISPSLREMGYIFCKTKRYNSGYLSQPLKSSFSETPFDDKSDLKASPTSEFYENENSLILLAMNSQGLKREVSPQKVSHSEEQNENCYDVMGDEPGIERRTVPEFYVNIITNEASYSPIRNNKTDSIQEVPEVYCYSGEWNEKWKEIQRYIKDQHLMYHDSAGDLISSTMSNTYFPIEKKNILKSLTQPRASANEDFIHKKNYDSKVCISATIMPPKTATTINDKVKTAVEREIPKINLECSAINNVAGSKQSKMQHFINDMDQIKSKDSEIQSEMLQVTSKVATNYNTPCNSVSFVAEDFPARNLKWKDIDKYNKEEHHIYYSGSAGELIPCTSGTHIHMPQMGHTTLRSLSQPTECHKMTQEVMLGCKNNVKVFKELSSSLQYSPCNTISEDDKIILSNKIAEHPDAILKTVDKELTETTTSKDVCTNDTNQPCDVLNISRSYALTGLHSCKILQGQLDGIEDQTVPNKAKTTDCENDERPYIVHNTNSPRDASNNYECKQSSPDVFADKDDDISLFADSPGNVLADDAVFNTNMKEMTQNALNSEDKSVQKDESVHDFFNRFHTRHVNDTPIHKLSQNVPEQLLNTENKNVTINNAEINDCKSRVEKTTNFASFDEESLLENTDYLYASDIFPMCLTQPAVPTYLLTNNNSELSDNGSNRFKTAIKTFKRCAEQSYKQKTENTTESFTPYASCENKNTFEVSFKSTVSKITSCVTQISSTLWSNQNHPALLCDSDNSQQNNFFSASPNHDAIIQENSIQISAQNEKSKLNGQTHQSRIFETESKVNAEHKSSCNKNAHTIVDHLHLSPMLDNGHKKESQILKDCLQNVSILDEQTQVEKTDNGYLNTKPSNDKLVIPVKGISKSENCTNATGNNPIFIQRSVEEKKFCSEIAINADSNLIQHSSSNDRYLDIAENLCNEYSLSSVKPQKSETTIQYLKKKDHQERDDHADSSEGEYDADVSISEATSESNIDLHIDDAIEKYQNTSFGSENTLIPGSQHTINTLEVSIQTDIFGLLQIKQCICKKFNFCCEFCNQDSPKRSENMEKKRNAISSDSGMPLNKKVKCFSEKILMDSSTNTETENKMQVGESIKDPEGIKTLSQVSFFNTSITQPPTAHDYKHSSEHRKKQHDIQGVYQHTQLFNWYTVEKSEPSQRSQEVNEQESQQKSKQRAPLHIGLSKRAKTKPLHYSYN